MLPPESLHLLSILSYLLFITKKISISICGSISFIVCLFLLGFFCLFAVNGLVQFSFVLSCLQKVKRKKKKTPRVVKHFNSALVLT